ncbi:protein asteroid homolog 1 isoform X2 [Empidonax traillii]|uniref:protein asteroid homolog 1 isoform X2 n=1 Tax=Empidonax traillii TaxID=164674 RepID=UPI000FFD641A|nr:protein asteroid homolog 1 isoform X2 [Empidonax traillii]
MGVQGLTGFVEERGVFFTELRVRDTKLVIDGSSLYHRLCFAPAADFRRGGDYGAFAAAVRDFFGTLRSCRVAPFVVLDGGRGAEDRKLPTLRGRAAEQLRAAHGLSRGAGGCLAPLLTREAFVQALGRLGVPFVQCFAEADREIAALANSWGCPVLSLDSDFCVFDLAGGYCPLSHFQWESVRAADGPQGCYVPARCFSVERFCRHFGRLNKSLLPLFAVMNGNDYVGLAALEAFFSKVRLPRGCAAGKGGRHLRLQGLLNWLAQFAEPTEAVENVLKYLKKHQREEIRELLCTSMEDYAPSDVNLEDFFQNGRWRTCRDRALTAHLCPSDKLSMDCSWGYLKILKLLLQMSMSCRQMLLLETLGVKMSFLESIPSHLQLPVAVTCYWIRCSEPKVKLHQLKALLLTIVSGELHRINDDPVLCAEDDSIAYNEFLKWKEKKLQNNDFDLDAAHNFCQWQCCLQMGLYLNQLLCTPLSEPDLSRLYTGILVHRLYQELKSTPSVENLFILSQKMTQLYLLLLNTVEATVSPEFFQKTTKTRSDSCKKKKASIKKKTAKCAMPENLHFCSVNRFASLEVDD